MVVKMKEYFEKTRQVKNNDKEMQDILKKYYQRKRNLIL